MKLIWIFPSQVDFVVQTLMDLKKDFNRLVPKVY